MEIPSWVEGVAKKIWIPNAKTLLNHRRGKTTIAMRMLWLVAFVALLAYVWADVPWYWAFPAFFLAISLYAIAVLRSERAAALSQSDDA
jgi:hypothetical protein